ncbi:MAG: hypothetical protein M1813_003311 [Trichoglossum hirsutum]|nr:MAG: hypothetical protein M1813_003311 [Trichoglossum hirsutum]
MTPAFGFSIGDFISAIDLIRKVVKALKDTGGASWEYQHVVVELKGLEKALRRLEALEPSKSNIDQVNAIRGMALSCQLPLQAFLSKLETYESSIGPSAPRSFGGSARKAEWAVFMTEEVKKLRALVVAKGVSINLLLATHCSETLSEMESRARGEHSNLLSRVIDLRAGVNDVRQEAQEIKEELVHKQAEHAVQQMEAANDLNNKVDTINESISHNTSQLNSISSTTSSIQTSIVSLRNLGGQFIQFINTFLAEMRELLQRVLRTNLQIYYMLLFSQSGMGRSPSLLLQSNIRFEDALGRVRELPYEWFRHWEPFEGLLRAEFKDTPGESKVLEGHYHLIDTGRQGRLIGKEDWSQSIFPGSTVSMSMILSELRRQRGMCPRPSCKGKRVAGDGGDSMVICSGRLEDHFERITVLEEDEEISKDQAEEDLLLFGSRPKPLDPEEVYSIAAEPMELDRLPRSTKRGAPASDNEELERPAKSYKRDPDELRTVQPEPPSGTQQTDPQSIILQALETREIEYFRNVHIKQPPSAPDHRRDEEPDSVEALAFGARIYYRNILDAYPAVPGYLARRLAEANWRRAERLRRGFWEGTESEEPRCESGNDGEAMVSAAGFSADVVAPTVFPSARLAIPEAGDDVALAVDPGAGATGSRRDFHHYLHEFHPPCIPPPPPIAPSSFTDPFGSPPDTQGLPATEPEVSF